MNIVEPTELLIINKRFITVITLYITMYYSYIYGR